MTGQKILSAQQRESWAERGFVVLPGFASRDEVEALRRGAAEAVAAHDLDAIRTVFDVKDQRHAEDPWFLDSGGAVRPFLEPDCETGPVVNKLGHALHDLLPAFDRFSRAPRVAALVAELGVRDPLLLQSMVIFKHPRVGGLVNPH